MWTIVCIVRGACPPLGGRYLVLRASGLKWPATTPFARKERQAWQLA